MICGSYSAFRRSNGQLSHSQRRKPVLLNCLEKILAGHCEPRQTAIQMSVQALIARTTTSTLINILSDISLTPRIPLPSCRGILVLPQKSLSFFLLMFSAISKSAAFSATPWSSCYCCELHWCGQGCTAVAHPPPPPPMLEFNYQTSQPA